MMKQLIRRTSKIADSSRCYEPLRSKKEMGRIVPEGHVPVFIGEEMEKFAVKAELLGHPIFLELLRRSAQEYGYEQPGVIRIPCPVPLFERVLDYILEPGRGGQGQLDVLEPAILGILDDNS